jgi:hypothetical protein
MTIATNRGDREFVVLAGGQIVAGPFATAAEAIKEREKLVEKQTFLC